MKTAIFYFNEKSITFTLALKSENSRFLNIKKEEDLVPEPSEHTVQVGGRDEYLHLQQNVLID
jgi:hypothetical protein